MALSGSYDFDLTCQELITEALELAECYEVGETVSAADIATCRRTLNIMVKLWVAKGVGLWLQQEVNFTLVEDQASYTIGKVGTEDIDEPRPLEIIEARHRNATTGNDIPLNIVSRETYMRLPDKSTGGFPTILYYDPQQTSGVIYLWQPMSNSTDSLYMTIKAPVQDFDANTNNANFPQEWLAALTTNLAVRIGPKFGAPISADLRLQAQIDFAEASGWDREQGSVFFQFNRR